MPDNQVIKKSIRVFLEMEFSIQPFGPFADWNLFNAASANKLATVATSSHPASGHFIMFPMPNYSEIAKMPSSPCKNINISRFCHVNT